MDKPTSDGDLLRQLIQHTLATYPRTVLLVTDLSARMDTFSPTVSDTSLSVVRRVLADARAANETSLDTLRILLKEVDLKIVFAAAASESEPNITYALEKQLQYSRAILAWHSFGMHVAACFLASAELHGLLSDLAGSPNPTNLQVAKEMTGAVVDYLLGLAKRVTLAEEIEEIRELVFELEKARAKLSKDKLTLTLEKIAILDRSISDFTQMAATVSLLKGKLEKLQLSATAFAVDLKKA